MIVAGPVFRCSLCNLSLLDMAHALRAIREIWQTGRQINTPICWVNGVATWPQPNLGKERGAVGEGCEASMLLMTGVLVHRMLTPANPI